MKEWAVNKEQPCKPYAKTAANQHRWGTLLICMHACSILKYAEIIKAGRAPAIRGRGAAGTSRAGGPWWLTKSDPTPSPEAGVSCHRTKNLKPTSPWGPRGGQDQGQRCQSPDPGGRRSRKRVRKARSLRKSSEDRRQLGAATGVWEEGCSQN